MPEVLLGTMKQSGAPLCAWRRIDVAHAAIEKCTLEFDVSCVFIDIFLPGKGFSIENIEFAFLVF